MTLEVEKTEAEVVKTTPSEETKPTELKETPTVRLEETAEFRHALDTALGKSMASINQQMTLSKQGEIAAKAETERFKAESASRQAHIQALTKEVDEALVDDPEKRQAYVSRIASLEREQKVAEREAMAEAKLLKAELKERNLAMALRAKELIEETGIPLSEIESCQTEAEMEVKALRFKLTKEPVEPEVIVPKVDSGISSGGAMSDDEFERKFGSGELDATIANLKRAKGIMDKRLKGG